MPQGLLSDADILAMGVTQPETPELSDEEVLGLAQQPAPVADTRFVNINGQRAERVQGGYEGDSEDGGFFIPDGQAEGMTIEPVPIGQGPQSFDSNIVGSIVGRDLTLGERAAQNFQEGYFYDNLAMPTIRQMSHIATAMMASQGGIPEMNVTGDDGYARPPTFGEALGALRQDMRERRAGQPYMPPANNAIELATDFASRIGGSVASGSPENFFGVSVARHAASPLARIALAAAAEAGINVAVDPAIQGLNISTGAQEEFSAMQTLLSAAMGSAIGAGGRSGVEGVNALSNAIRGSARARGVDLGQGQFGPDNSVSVDQALEILSDPAVRQTMQDLGYLDPTNPAHTEILTMLADAAPTTANLPGAARVAQSSGNLTPEGIARVDERLTAREGQINQLGSLTPDTTGTRAARSEFANIDRLNAERQGIEAGTIDPAFASTAGRQPQEIPPVIQAGDGTTRPRREAFPNATARDAGVSEGARAANEAADRVDTEAGQAFASAERQRGRAGDDIRDTQPAGRPEGVDATRVPVELHEGFPVDRTGVVQTVRVPGGTEERVQVVRQRRNPETGQLEADPEATPYFVDPATIENAAYVPRPRGAQDFETRAGSPRNPEEPRMATESVQRQPRQTYRTTPEDAPLRPDGTSPDTGAGGPTGGRSPFPDQTRANEGEGPFRPFTRAEEVEAAARAESARAANDADRRAGDAYANARATNEPRVTDGDFDIDEFGFVKSSGDGPVVFSDVRQLARAILNWQGRSRSGQFFEPANYPGRTGAWTVRERGRSSSQGPDQGGGKAASSPRQPRLEGPPPQGRSTRPASDRPSQPPEARSSAGAGRRQSLAEFLAELGGVRDTNGDLRSMGADKWHRSGAYRKRLVTENGLDPDKAREAAEEAGYIARSSDNETTTVRDLLDALDEEMRGSPRYLDEDAAARADSQQRAADDELRQRVNDVRSDVEDAVQKRGYGSHLSDEDITDVSESLARNGYDGEGDILDAVEAHLERKEREALDAESAGSGGGEPPRNGDGPEDEFLDNVSSARSARFYSNPLDPDLFVPFLRDIYGYSARQAQSLRSFLKTTTSDMVDGFRSGDIVAPFRALWRLVFLSSHQKIHAVANLRNSPTAKLIGDLLYAEPGSRGRVVRKTMDDAIEEHHVSKTNELTNIYVDWLGERAFKRVGRQAREELDEKFTQLSNLLRRGGTFDQSTSIGRAAEQVRKLLKDEIKYLRDAGVEVGEVKNGFLPRVIDNAKVMEDPDGFVQAAAEAFRHKDNGGLSRADALAAAEKWRDHALGYGELAGSLSMGNVNSRPDFLKGRTLADWVDDPRRSKLAEYYVSDTRELLGSYFTRSARVAEWTRRFGENGSRWQDEFVPKLMEEGLTTADLRTVRRALEEVSGIGVRTTPDDPSWRAFNGFMRTWNVTGLLERATITSIAEAVAPAIRSGNVMDAGRSVFMTLANLVGEGRHKELAAAMEDLGLLWNVIDGSYMSARWADFDNAARSQARIMDAYFKRIGLEGWTRATRIAAVGTGQVFIRRLVREAKNSRISREDLAELGIDEKHLDGIRALFEEHGEIPPLSALKDAGEAADAYVNALRRFMDQSIMRPTRATRPSWANRSVIGSLAYQLQSFLWAFGRNAVYRPLRKARRGLTEGWIGPDRLSIQERAQLLGPATGLGLYATTAMGVSVLRDYLTMPESRRNEQTPAEYWLRHVSRAGVLAQFDPWLNLAMGVRYNRSVTQGIIGPALGRPGDFIDTAIRAVVRNNENTNHAERALVEGIYDVGIEPALNMALGFAPGGSNLFSIPGLTTQVAGAPKTREAFVNFFAGEEERTSGSNRSRGRGRSGRSSRRSSR